MSSSDARPTQRSDIIVRAFRALCSKHGLRVAMRGDDRVLGSYVVFRDDCSALNVEVDNGGYSAWFDQYQGETLMRKVDMGRILRRVGKETELSYSARDTKELDCEMRKLADLCERYAGRAIAGDPTFYDELYAES
jgi:hypothetical protein